VLVATIILVLVTAAYVALTYQVAGASRDAADQAEAGISAETYVELDEIPQLFEPFFTTKDVGHSTGLGLDISRRIIVDRHAGDISVTGDGDETVFRVSLPLSR
jgi:nitrogen-specific signal transduction histidine kinase